MKKIVFWVASFIVFCLFVCSLVMFFYCKSIENKLDIAIEEVNINDENVISIVDTIYGKKYIIAVDTITGRVKIMGQRHNPVMIEDSIP